jgi:hypothetical protein
MGFAASGCAAMARNGNQLPEGFSVWKYEAVCRETCTPLNLTVWLVRTGPNVCGFAIESYGGPGAPAPEGELAGAWVEGKGYRVTYLDYTYLKIEKGSANLTVLPGRIRFEVASHPAGGLLELQGYELHRAELPNVEIEKLKKMNGTYQSCLAHRNMPDVYLQEALDSYEKNYPN